MKACVLASCRDKVITVSQFCIYVCVCEEKGMVQTDVYVAASVHRHE